MSAELFDLVDHLGLQTGDVYRAEKDGRKVEVRVLDGDDAPRPEVAESVMLNIIVDVPHTGPSFPVKVKFGKHPLPAPPIISPDDYYPEEPPE